MPSQRISTHGKDQQHQEIPHHHGAQLVADYEGRLYKKSDSLHKKQMGIEKGILLLKEKIATAKPTEAKVLKTELKQLKTLRYELFVEQRKDEQSFVGRICSVWRYLMSNSKQFVVPQKEVENFQKQVATVFHHEIRNIGKDNTISFERAGRELSYVDLIALTEHRIELGKRLLRENPELEGTPAAKELAKENDEAEVLLRYLRTTHPDITQHVSTKQFIASMIQGPLNKGKTSQASEGMREFFTSDACKIIEDSGKYLATSDSRVTVWEDPNKELSQKMKILVRATFPEEIKVGETRRSYLGKTNIEFITAEGKQLSKAELVEKTTLKIQEIQTAMKSIKHDKAHAKEIQNLNRTLLTAEQLVEVLLDKKVVEYLSTKREVLFGVLKGISLFSDTINYLANQPQELFDEWKFSMSVKQLLAPYTLFRKEEDVEALKVQTQAALKLLSEKGDAFEKAITEIMAKASSADKQIIRKLVGNKNRALELALSKGNTRAAHFLISQGMFKSVSNKVLAKVNSLPQVSTEARELLVRDLFAQASDQKSILRIIDYLANTGEAALAEQLVAEVLISEKAKPVSAEGTPLSEKHIACVHLAAQISSDRLLELAFGITGESTLKEMMQAVKPYVFLHDPYGETILGYACGGRNVQFVTAVDFAIKDKYLEVKPVDDKVRELQLSLQECQENNFPESFIAALERQSQSVLDPENRKNYRQWKMDDLQGILGLAENSSKRKDIPYRLAALAKDFPELHYLVANYEKHPKDLKNHIMREIENLGLDPFLARNAELIRPVQSMSPSLAADMDRRLEDNALPLQDGSKPHVECFGKAVKYYDALRSKSHIFAQILDLTGIVYSWVSYFSKILPSVVAPVSSSIKYAMMSKSYLMDIYIATFSTLVATWSVKKIAEEVALDSLQGYDRNLHQYRNAYPLDKPISEGLVSVPPGEIHTGFFDDVYTTVEHWNPMTKGSLLEQSIARKMVHQDTEEVISLLDNLKQKEGKVDGGRILDGYRKLTRYPEDTRTEIFERLFDVLGSAKHLDSAIDLQLNCGLRGRECVRKCIHERADAWHRNGVPNQYQYEAAIFAAVKLGDLELLEKLLDIKVAAAEFAAAGRWKHAGEDNTSLLHEAIATKNPTSSKNKAAMVRRIYEETIRARRLELAADPLKTKKDLDPLATSRKGKFLLDTISFADASALDKEFGLNPQMPGSFSHTIELRVRAKAGDSTSESIVTYAPSMIIGMMTGPTANIAAFSAAMAAAKFGPVAMIAADVATRMLVLKTFSIFGATTAMLVGGSFTQTLHQLENEVYSGSPVIAQLGNTQKEREELLKKTTGKENPFILNLERQTDIIARQYLLQGIDDALLAAKETGDFLSQKDLESLKQEIERLPAKATHKEVVDSLHHFLIRADIAPPIRFIINQPLAEALSNPTLLLEE